MRLGFVKDKNCKLIRKWVQDGEEGKDPNVLYQVDAMFGDYTWTDEEHMEEARDALLERMFTLIRNLAKMDEFWIVKTVDDMWNDFQNSILSDFHKLNREEWLGYQSQEAKDGKRTVGVKIEFPQMLGYHKWEDADKLRKQVEKCGDHLNNG